MNKCHLGDAYDYVKDVLLRHLTEVQKKTITVVPMRTGKDWKDDEIAYYKRITCTEDVLLLDELYPGGNRVQYFDKVSAGCDVIFADPNIGIKSSNLTNGHITLANCATLAGKCNILIVYDQSFNRHEREVAVKEKKKEKDMKNKLIELNKNKIYGFYLNLQTSFVFLSMDDVLLIKCKQSMVDAKILLESRIVYREEEGVV